jgi:ArsR family transcriptional regulator
MPDTLRQFKAEIFQSLANPTRIAIVDTLRDGALTVGALAERLGAEQSNVSQHLAILRARQIVATRKVANQVFYSVRDSLIWEMLDLMRAYFEKQVAESAAMLASPGEVKEP